MPWARFIRSPRPWNDDARRTRLLRHTPVTMMLTIPSSACEWKTARLQQRHFFLLNPRMHKNSTSIIILMMIMYRNMHKNSMAISISNNRIIRMILFTSSSTIKILLILLNIHNNMMQYVNDTYRSSILIAKHHSSTTMDSNEQDRTRLLRRSRTTRPWIVCWELCIGSDMPNIIQRRSAPCRQTQSSFNRRDVYLEIVKRLCCLCLLLVLVMQWETSSNACNECVVLGIDCPSDFSRFGCCSLGIV